MTGKEIARYVPKSLLGLRNYLYDWVRAGSIEYNPYLRSEGWFRSAKLGLPVTETGKKIPWYTYPFIEFIDSRLSADFSVFEYGSGYSTLWYANRVDDVVGVEHNRGWVDKISPKLPENGEILYEPDNTQYVDAVTEQSPRDIIVIDGEQRDNCVDPAISALSSDGVIILDDFHLLTSDFDYPYQESDFQRLFDEFNVMPFYGPKALVYGKRCTAIFYRDENCLKI